MQQRHPNFQNLTHYDADLYEIQHLLCNVFEVDGIVNILKTRFLTFQLNFITNFELQTK